MTSCNNRSPMKIPPNTFCFALLIGALLTTTPVLAEKSKFKYTKPLGSRQTLSTNTIQPGDRPGHDFTQSVLLDKYETTDTEYKGAIGHVFNQEESIAGTGTHRGTTVDVLKNGDKVFWKYEGTHHTTVKDGGAWETTCSGKGEITGGTGKYKNAKGVSPYRCKVSPDGYYEEGEQDWEY
jgi:hypothetical protein